MLDATQRKSARRARPACTERARLRRCRRQTAGRTKTNRESRQMTGHRLTLQAARASPPPRRWRFRPAAASRSPRRRSPSRAGATTTPIIWNNTIIPAFEKAHPDIKVVFNADGADRIQRRAQLAARRRHRRRPHHLPAVRRLARPLQQGLSGLAQRPARHGELLRRRQERLDHRRRQDDLLRADGLGHPRLHLQQGHLRRARPARAPKTVDEFYAVLDKIKADGNYAPLDIGTADQWEAATMGFQNIGPNYWKGEEGRKALIAGTAKFTDQPYVDTWARAGQVGALHGRRLPGAELSRQPEPLHPRQGRHLSGRLVGHHHLREAGRLRVRRLPAAGARRPATPATSATTPTSPWA